MGKKHKVQRPASSAAGDIPLWPGKLPPTPAAMSAWMLFFLLTALAAISVSGIGLWYCMEYRAEGQLDASLWELFWRQVHGWSVPAMLVVFGMVLRAHVIKGFRLAKNRFSGSLLLLTMVWLTISGWGLYYCAQDWWRHFYRETHEWFGFGLLGVLVAHWFLGYRSRGETRSGGERMGALRQTGVFPDPGRQA